MNQIIKELNPKLIQKVSSELSGKRLLKFQESVNIMNLSLKQEGWVKNGSRKAVSGFYQGVLNKLQNFGTGNDSHQAYMCIKFGYPMENPSKINQIIKSNQTIYNKYSKEFILAWAELCVEVRDCIDTLNSLRPVPVITPIGLSPKVTTTLKEMNLDIDMQSIKYPKIGKEKVKASKDGVLLKDKYGRQVWDWRYFIKWTKGIKHNQSRFSDSMCHCEACGKMIPSGMFVPVEAKDNKSGNIISLWLGQDCAKNIFGVKDIGFKNRNSKP